MLRTRILTAAILATVLLAALFLLPPPAWRVFSFFIALVALWEWTRMARFGTTAAWCFLAASLIFGVLLLSVFEQQEPAAGGFPQTAMVAGFGAACAFWFIGVPLWLKKSWRPRHALVLAITGWVVIMPTWFALIVFREQSPWLLLALMALVWVADIAAYAAGRAFGRRKLAPGISPGKTWEGVYGALLATLLYAVLCVWLSRRFGDDAVRGLFAEWPTVLFAFPVLTALAVLGDLFESWMKRCAGLKDSSHLLPGHGGVLDRIDALTSTLSVAPLVFFLAGKISSP